MAFFLYVAVVLVSISSILLELDWLTKPKLEQPVPVAQNTTARPVPVPQGPRETVATAEATNKADTAKFEPTAKKVERPRETTGSAPANERLEAMGVDAVLERHDALGAGAGDVWCWAVATHALQRARATRRDGQARIIPRRLASTGAKAGGTLPSYSTTIRGCSPERMVIS